MHIEFLVEDISSKRLLDKILPKLITDSDLHTYKIYPYRGIGDLPKNLTSARDIKRYQLLNDLPRLLRGFGRTFAGYGETYTASIIVICDLDENCLKELRYQLQSMLADCMPAPSTRFCIAIEEMEAWLLGDRNAIELAYPNRKSSVLYCYEQDSICGTWEILADAVYKGGSKVLKAMPYYIIGEQKSKWANEIGKYLNIGGNESPSFQYFWKTVLDLIGKDKGVNR
jgi:hypothetical protein